MTRIVAHVSFQGDRLLLRWSEGRQFFQPCIIDGPELTRLLELASAARARLAQAPADTFQLAQLGHEMYRLLLPDRVSAVREWLQRYRGSAVGDGLEIAGDGAGLVPWALIHDQPPNEADFRSAGPGSPCWQPFWGVRHSLSTTYRYNPLRSVRVLQQPTVLLAIDPELRDSLPGEQQVVLARFLQGHAGSIVGTLDDLLQRMRQTTPDVLYVLANCSGRGLRLGGVDLTPTLLREALQASEQGQTPWNNLILMVNACGAGLTPGWAELRRSLLLMQVSGLVVPEVPLPADQACAAGLDLLESFLHRGDPLCEGLRNLRAAHAPLGLGFTTTCPLQLQVQLEGSPPPDDSLQELPPLPATPYRPLQPCDRPDRTLLIGRDDDLAQVAQMVDAACSRIVLVHGRAGVGKSSLLRAGVLPALEDEAVGYRPLTDRGESGQAESECPVLAVRVATDLPGQLAVALCAFAAQPYRYTTPTGNEVEVDLLGILALGLTPATARDFGIRQGEPPAGGPAIPTLNVSIPTPQALRQAFREKPALLAVLLDRLCSALPHELVVLIEQGEELYTLTRTQEHVKLRREGLELLRQLSLLPGEGRLLIALRTEYLGRVQGQLPRGGVHSHYLTALDRQDLQDVILQPTREDLPRAETGPLSPYGFKFSPGMAEQIATEALQASNDRGEEALPLVQMVCARLVERVKSQGRGTILPEDLKAIGGVAGGTGRFLDAQLAKLRLETRERKKLRELLLQLGRRQPEGTLTRELILDVELAKPWRGATPFGQVLDALADDEVRVLEPAWVAGTQGDRRFSLTSDALLPELAERQEKDRTSKAVWTRVLDVLWIAVPLMILLLVYTGTWVRSYYRQQEEARETLEEKDKNLEMLKGGFETAQTMLLSDVQPKYLAQVQQAADALRSGHLLRAQQLLHAQRVALRDQRGFEWYHLWERARGNHPGLRGHLGPISGIAVSSNGKLAATSSQDGKIKLWRLPEQIELATLKDSQGPVHGVGMSSDGKTLVAAGADGTVRVWSVSQDKDKLTTKLTHALTGHKDAVLTLALSADGKLAVTGDAGGNVKLWNVEQGKESASDKEHVGPVHAVVISPDGKTIVSGGVDRQLVWRDGAGKRMQAQANQPGPITALAFSGDGQTVASGHRTEQTGLGLGVVKLWDGAGKARGQPIDLPFAVLALTFTEAGLAVGGQDQRLVLLDPANGKINRELSGHLGWVSALASAGPRLFSGGYDATVQVWNLAPTVLHSHKDWVTALALSPDDKVIAVGGRDGAIKLWDAATGKELRTLTGQKGPVRSLSFAQRDQEMILASADSEPDGKGGATIHLWKTDKDQPWKSLKGQHEKAVHAVAFSGDGKLLATASADGDVRLLDPDTEKVTATLRGHKNPVQALAFSRGGKYLASGDQKGNILLWSPSTGTHVGRLGEEEIAEKKPKYTGHTAGVTALAFAPDGTHLVSASDDQALKRWDVQKKLLISTWRGHSGPVLAVAASPKGEVFVSGSRDGSVKLWDVLRGNERFTLSDHAGPVRGVAFSSSRRLLVTAGHDGTVRLYHAAPEETPPEPMHGLREEGE